MRTAVVFLGLLLIAVGASAAADEDSAVDKLLQQAGPLAPTDISSDRMEFDMANRQLSFVGQVRVNDDRFDLQSDRLTAILDEKMKIQRLIADGHVIISREDMRATGGRAEYDVANGVITLSEDPILQQGNALMGGTEHVVYNLTTEKATTEGEGRPKPWFRYVHEEKEEPAKQIE